MMAEKCFTDQGLGDSSGTGAKQRYSEQPGQMLLNEIFSTAPNNKPRVFLR